jgi:hypothetical protein
MIRSDRILKKYENLQDILLDKNLAKLGDSYVNLIYSLALSEKLQRPTGVNVDNQTLATAIKKSGLRKVLPKRVDRHEQANAAEALIAYAWLNKFLGFERCLKNFRENERSDEAFAKILKYVCKRMKLEKCME